MKMLLILHHCVGLSLIFQLTESCGRVVELRRAPRTGSQIADAVQLLQKRVTWFLTPLLALTLYLSFWLLDADHQRLRSLWSLVTLLVMLGALSLDFQLRRQLAALRGGVGSDTGAHSLSRMSRAIFSAALLLSLTYWGLQI